MNWLQKLRVERGVTQEDIAAALKVSTRTYQRWESSPDDLPGWRIGLLLADLDPDHEYVLQSSQFGLSVTRRDDDE